MQIELPKEAIQKYIERRKTDVENCRHALETGDLSVLETVGHQLKGNGSTFGFPEISDVGKSLEQAAKAHDNEAAARFVDELDGIVKRTTLPH